MASTSDSGSALVCGVLCFIQNKISYVPEDKLKEVVLRGFSDSEIEQAKNLVFEVASKVPELKDVEVEEEHESQEESRIRR